MLRFCVCRISIRWPEMTRQIPTSGMSWKYYKILQNQPVECLGVVKCKTRFQFPVDSPQRGCSIGQNAAIGLVIQSAAVAGALMVNSPTICSRKSDRSGND